MIKICVCCKMEIELLFSISSHKALNILKKLFKNLEQNQYLSLELLKKKKWKNIFYRVYWLISTLITFNINIDIKNRWFSSYFDYFEHPLCPLTKQKSYYWESTNLNPSKKARSKALKNGTCKQLVKDKFRIDSLFLQNGFVLKHMNIMWAL